MITRDRLTGDRQFMNMDQFHRFGQSDLYQEMIADYCIKRIILLIRYTLCEYQEGSRRNNSRHSLVFAIPAILRKRTVCLVYMQLPDNCLNLILLHDI